MLTIALRVCVLPVKVCTVVTLWALSAPCSTASLGWSRSGTGCWYLDRGFSCKSYQCVTIL